MQKVFQILFLFVLLLFGESWSLTSVDYSYRLSFAVKIGVLPNGSLTQFALVYYKNNRQVSAVPIELNRLEKIASGKWPLPNSNHFYNYFEAYGFLEETLADGTIVDYHSSFDSIWKIRFDRHPFEANRGKGWSNGEAKPSLSQQEYLYERYGSRIYDQAYVEDSSFFQLLKDVIDPVWIANYKSLK